MQLLETFVTSAVLTTALGLILKEWLSARIKESISAEYARALETFKSQIRWEEKRKEEAAEMAELFSLWLKSEYYPSENVDEIRYDLQLKYWRQLLWVDAPVLRAIHEAFKGAGEPGTGHKHALIAARKLLVGRDDPIAADELWHFDPVKYLPRPQVPVSSAPTPARSTP
jgi:hypothetical protein